VHGFRVVARIACNREVIPGDLRWGHPIAWPPKADICSALECFADGEALADIERRCRCTACGWRRADLPPDYSVQTARNS